MIIEWDNRSTKVVPRLTYFESNRYLEMPLKRGENWGSQVKTSRSSRGEKNKGIPFEE